MADRPAESPETQSRRRALGLLVRATSEELQAPLAQYWPGLAARDLKPPEAGLVMLRGRAGGDGAMFNLGEATVARAIVELDSGERGFGHVLGRDLDQARRIAILDALGQRPEDRARLQQSVLAPIAARLQGGEADRWLRFHTGAPPAARPRDAAFAWLDLAEDELRLEDFALGAPEYPDRSTTLVLACESLLSSGPLSLSGPGINGVQRFSFAPTPLEFLTQWRANVARFPLGVDLILTHATSLAALPRTTRIVGGA